MASSSAFPDIPVTAAEIIRQVGHAAYSRGQKYMRAGNVARYTFDPDTRTLTGEVNGSAVAPYSVTVRFPAQKTAGSLVFSAQCTCPVRTDCKHAVALMLTAIDRATKVRKALTASSDTWRSSVADPTPRMGESMREKTGGLDALPEDLQNKLADFGVYAASKLADNTSGTDTETQPGARLPEWRRRLSHVLAARPEFGDDSAQRVSGALDLRLHVGSKYAIGQSSAGLPQVQVQARPMMLGARGTWIKGGLSWEDFQRDLIRGHLKHSVYPEHERWFAEFYSVVRPWQSAYTSHRDWVSLSAVNSSLLWQVLARAQEIDLPFLIDGQQVTAAMAPATGVQVRVEEIAERGLTDADRLALTPILSWDDFSIETANCHKLGDPRSGFLALGGRAQAEYVGAAQTAKWSATRAAALGDDRAEDATGRGGARPDWLPSDCDLLFVPLADPLDPMAESLASTGSIEVPAADREPFLREFYPRLARTLTLHTDEAGPTLPQVATPELVLSVQFDENEPHSAATSWHWEYPTDPLNPDGERASLPALGYPGEDHAETRDTKFEYRVLKQVKAVRPVVPFTRHRTEGWATRTLVEDTLPRYEAIDGVRVDTHGPVPEFKELEEAPEITVSVESTGDRDWFGLGIAIKAGEWYVPFAKIFEALNAGKSHLLLGDGSYFALDRPEFMKLQELLREATGLQDKKTPLQISRHQAGMWEELEELAASVETVDAWEQQVTALLNIENTAVAEVPEELHAELRPYQLEGFQWLSFLYDHSLGGVLADDMGLGKTVQTIAMFAYARARWVENAKPGETFPPFLVVAPTSVVPNWERELTKFAPSLKVEARYASEAKSARSLADAAPEADVLLTSYALFRREEEAYAALGAERAFSGLILDEAQFVKNAKTKAHRAARDLPARFKVAVTGTPMENNLMELWSMFSIVAPGLFPSARQFKDLYANPIESGEDKQALPRLRRRIRPLMKRRTKDLVAADLPEKNDVRVDVPLSAGHRRAYDTALQRERKKVLGLLEDMDKNRFTVFQSLTTLRRMALDASLIDEERYGSLESAKLDYLQENLPEIIADGHRSLIFSQFTSYLKKIAARLETLGIPYLYLDGSTRDRPSVLAAFEEGTAPVFLISLKAGGFGLNLTSADYCFIMDPWWNPAAEQQAVDRVHRIGQRRNVMVYRLVSAGTIEEKVMDLKESKAQLFDAVVDEGQFFSSQLTAEQVRDLLTEAE
ncbi:DEAD/DEAH box helicase [Rothia sp. LK2588]|uniref:DEAD/DEAH box helicase n=1 Tax=Rothia sp. LK2588 TaxID=3114369 RepID=UPI0034CD41C3